MSVTHPDTWFANIFSHSMACLLTFLKYSCCMIFSLLIVIFDILSFTFLCRPVFLCLCLWCYDQEITTDFSVMKTFPFLFFSFIVLAPKSRSLTHFELIFVRAVRGSSSCRSYSGCLLTPLCFLDWQRSQRISRSQGKRRCPRQQPVARPWLPSPRLQPSSLRLPHRRLARRPCPGAWRTSWRAAQGCPC